MLYCYILFLLLIGTKRYMSPEILEEIMDFEVFSEYKMADIYSFSYVLWELFHCKLCILYMHLNL